MAEQQSFFGRGKWQNPEMERQKSYGPRRFWLPVDDGSGKGKTKVIFLDGAEGDMFFLFEHQVKLGESWQNWWPCMQNWNEPCELCDVGDDPNYLAMLSVMTTYQNRKQEWVATRQLFPMKQQTYKVIQDLAAARGGDITRWVVRIARVGERSANVGSAFDFERKIPDHETLCREVAPLLGWIGQQQLRPGQKRWTVEDYCKPFDYVEAFQKPDPKELIRVARRLRYSPITRGGEAPAGGGPRGEDIPF